MLPLKPGAHKSKKDVFLLTATVCNQFSPNNSPIYTIRNDFFFSAWPRPLTLNSEILGCARLLGEPLGFGVKKWYFFKRSGRGSNPEPRASEEDALSTPLCPTWLSFLQYFRYLLPGISLLFIQTIYGDCSSESEISHQHKQLSALKENQMVQTFFKRNIAESMYFPWNKIPGKKISRQNIAGRNIWGPENSRNTNLSWNLRNYFWRKFQDFILNRAENSRIFDST